MAATSRFIFDFSSPIGFIRITGDHDSIHELRFVEECQFSEQQQSPAIEAGTRQLKEYFIGTRKSFSLPLQLNGTQFQNKIWELLCSIPYGRTISYLQLAHLAGNKKLTRAAGLANAANKLAIVIPCHRVIGSSGKLVGYAGGLWRKEWLLRFEEQEKQPVLFPQHAWTDSYEKI